MSTESGKEIPLCTEVAKRSQRVTRFPTHIPRIRRCTNAERLFTDTKKNAIRIAGELEMAEQELNASCAQAVAHTDSKDQASRIDVAQLLEPDAASRVVLDDMCVIGDEDELDLTEDERTAYQARKKKFAEDMVAAARGAHSAKSSMRNVQKLVRRKGSGRRNKRWRSSKSDQESTTRLTCRTLATWATQDRPQNNKAFRNRPLSAKASMKNRGAADSTAKIIRDALRAVFVDNGPPPPTAEHL